ncbi:MAG: hypothetical protein NTV54_00465 [Ignavibacteriales bacterium]|nr:hypothetical protein [Ignavibacteriales bacterium]
MKLLPMVAIITLFFTGCVNPFAPHLDDSPDRTQGQLDDLHTIDGVLQTIKKSYSYRDTTIYGKVLASDYIFVYRDYDKGADVFWGRDEEIRSTFGLFENVQRLDLVWNNSTSVSGDTVQSLRATVVKGFNLTVTFNPSDVVRITGYANLTLQRPSSDATWLVTQWRDESNY